MSKIVCLLIGHKWSRGILSTVKHGVIEPDVFLCIRCKKTKPAPATFYTPMDIPPAPKPTSPAQKGRTIT